ncbi:MAG: two-component system sensor histidine kinase NtrB [Spirochaetota bacterium]
MRKFVERALAKFDKLDAHQVRSLLHDLATERERFDAVLDSLNDALIVCDNNHRVDLYNKASERLLPMSRHYLIDELVWDVITDEDISRFIERTLLNQESVVDREFTLQSGGITRILAFSITPLVRHGAIQGSIIHVADVSDRRSREARLRRAESLASLTTLAAGVAHEIKNPLGSIGIHMQLIQKTVSALSDERTEAIEEYIGVVNEEVDRLNKIVVDFLFAVRPMNTNLEDEDLNPIVQDLVDFVKYELEQADISVVSELADDLPMLRLDEKYLKQAILNLVKNAIAAMPAGGELRVTTRRVGDDVELRISDTGEGIDDSVINKIFEPYFTTRDHGSGIGLTLVYKVVKEHMGDISVVSQRGKGSAFSLLFPVPQRETRLLGFKDGQ